MTATAKKTVAKKTASPVTKSGTAARYKDSAKITVKAKDNPKREGTKAHKAFKLYRTGQTVRACLDAGQTRSNLRYDVEHGYIAIS